MGSLKGLFKIVVGSLFYVLFIYLFGFIFATALIATFFLIKKTLSVFSFLIGFDSRRICSHCGTKAKEKCISKKHVGFGDVENGSKDILKECTNCGGEGRLYNGVYKINGVFQDLFDNCTKCDGSGEVHDRYEAKFRRVKIYEQLFECTNCHVQDTLVSEIVRSSRKKIYNPAVSKSAYLALGWLVVISILMWKINPAIVTSSYILKDYPLWVSITDKVKPYLPDGKEDQKKAYADAYRITGKKLRRNGKYKEATQLFETALQSDLAYFGDASEYVGQDYSLLGGVWRARKNYSQSIKYYNLALPIYLALYGKNNIYVSNVYGNLAGALLLAGQINKAIYYFELSLEISIDLGGNNELDVANKRYNLASALSKKGEYDKSLQHFRQVLNVYERKLGVKHRLTRMVKSRIKKLNEKL